MVEERHRILAWTDGTVHRVRWGSRIIQLECGILFNRSPELSIEMIAKILVVIVVLLEWRDSILH